MANFVENEDVNDKLQPIDDINSYIECLWKLKAELKESKKKQDYWKSKRSALYANVLSKKIKYSQNKKWETVLRNSITEIMNQNDATQTEWKNLHAKRAEQRAEKCRNFSIKGIQCANIFPRAHCEYSAENLMTCINGYQVTSNKVENELHQLKAKMDELYEMYTNECLKTNRESDEFKLNNLLQFLKLTNTHIHSAISTDQRVQDLQNRIKQAKETLKKYKTGQMTPGVFRKPRPPL